MKEDIHPAYHQVTVTCACGNSFVTGSTKKSIRLEICSNCHPFFTGQQKMMDTAGRVDRFKKRLSKKVQTAPKKKVNKQPQEEAEA